MSQTIQRKMTDEVREKLKALGGFNLSDTIKIVPKTLREGLPKEYWPVYTFEYLSNIKTLKLTNFISNFGNDKLTDDEKVENFSLMCDFLSNELLSVDNLYDENTGELVDTENLDKKFIMSKLSVGLLSDIAVDLMTNNKLTEDEKEGLT